MADDRDDALLRAGMPQSMVDQISDLEGQFTAALVDVLPAGWVVRFDTTPLLDA